MFIDEVDSFAIDGSIFSSKNADFNRRLAKYQSVEARSKMPKDERKGAELDCPKFIEARRLYRKSFRQTDFFLSVSQTLKEDT